MKRGKRERMLTGSTIGIGLGAIVLVWWWSIRPIASVTLRTINAPTLNQAIEPEVMTLEASAFEQDLWFSESLVQPATTQPEEQQAPPAQAASQSVSLTLVALIQEGNQWRAALYDPRDQRLVVVAPEQSIGDILVREITPKTVMLEVAGRQQTLTLREDER